MQKSALQPTDVLYGMKLSNKVMTLIVYLNIHFEDFLGTSSDCHRMSESQKDMILSYTYIPDLSQQFRVAFQSAFV